MRISEDGIPDPCPHSQLGPDAPQPVSVQRELFTLLEVGHREGHGAAEVVVGESHNLDASQIAKLRRQQAVKIIAAHVQHLRHGIRRWSWRREK